MPVPDSDSDVIRLTPLVARGRPGPVTVVTVTAFI